MQADKGENVILGRWYIGKSVKFYKHCTFFEDEQVKHATTAIMHDTGGIVTYPEKDLFHYIFSTFDELGRQVGLKVNLIGKWNHPRNQQIMVFTHG